MNLAAVVFASKPMRGLVNKAESKQQQPKLGDVVKSFVCEVEVERNIGADDAPVVNEDERFKGKQQQDCENAPAVVNEIARSADRSRSGSDPGPMQRS